MMNLIKCGSLTTEVIPFCIRKMLQLSLRNAQSSCRIANVRRTNVLLTTTYLAMH